MRLSPQQLEQYHRDGYLIFPGLFSQREIAVLREETARLSRQHNDLNVLALAGRATSRDKAIGIVAAWLGTAFEGGRHERRLQQIREAEGM